MKYGQANQDWREKMQVQPLLTLGRIGSGSREKRGFALVIFPTALIYQIPNTEATDADIIP